VYKDPNCIFFKSFKVLLFYFSDASNIVKCYGSWPLSVACYLKLFCVYYVLHLYLHFWFCISWEVFCLFNCFCTM